MTSFSFLFANLVFATVTALAVAPPPPAPVRLGSASAFVILTNTGISTVSASAVTGDIGVSPISATAMPGFNLIPDTSNTFSASKQVTGKCYHTWPVLGSEYLAVEFTSDAISDMKAAYTDAAGRAISDPANLGVKAGLISGEAFTPGVYKWSSDLSFATDIYLKGNSSSLFLFQTTSNVIAGSGARVILQDDGTGSAPLASNIVWQVGGFLEARTTAHLEGVFLVKTKAVLKAGSSLNGRLLAQTSCSLDATTITQPPA